MRITSQLSPSTSLPPDRHKNMASMDLDLPCIFLMAVVRFIWRGDLVGPSLTSGSWFSLKELWRLDARSPYFSFASRIWLSQVAWKRRKNSFKLVCTHLQITLFFVALIVAKRSRNEWNWRKMVTWGWILFSWDYDWYTLLLYTRTRMKYADFAESANGNTSWCQPTCNTRLRNHICHPF